MNNNCQHCLRLDPDHCAGLTNIYNINTHHINIILNLNKKCNLCCSFCYNSNLETKPDIELDTLTHLFEYLYTIKDTSFSFYILGGEPSLFPHLIDYTAEMSLKIFSLIDIRIYSNGYCNLREMNQIAQRYKNISFIISKNYKFRLCYDLNKYCFDASLYISTTDTPELIYQKIAYIKALGYKYCTCNFDIIHMPDNLNEYVYHGVQILQRCRQLEEQNFHITNFNHSKTFQQTTLTINFFGDEKFYFSHIENTKPIGDLTNQFDEEQLKKSLLLYNKCPSCNLKNICKTYNIDFNLSRSFSPYCVTQIINSCARDHIPLGEINDLFRRIEI